MINAKIIADSRAPSGKRITTFELEYPRFIHSEFMTHRMLSRNAASSRAIPVMAMIKAVWNNPACPVYWGRSQSGMQAKTELNGWPLFASKLLWFVGSKIACILAWLLNVVGCHKQIANRVLEPWSHIKVVATATEWDNFFHLRNHPDAQPEIHELARQMWSLYKTNKPKHLAMGEWHLPYVESNGMTENEALKLSASLCAQVSYRKADESLHKATLIYDRLVTSQPVHASPFEHQATPSEDPTLVSGNLRGWKQFRQTIPGNNCKKYEGD